MWLIIVEYLVLVACVHIRGVSPIQGAGLEGFHCSEIILFLHNIAMFLF